MQPRDASLLLADIVEACDLIARFIDGRLVDDYLSDLMARAAVERQFEIIGGAMKRPLQLEPGLSLRLPEAHEVVQFRNFLAHGYHLIDHSIVWRIAMRDVPALRARAAEVLAERRH